MVMIMHQSRFFFTIALFAIMLLSCIEHYEPEISNAKAVKFVVEG
jgi:hypothetical protein